MTNITLLDGGMSRELERCGAELRQPEWSALALMEAPDAVRLAHEAFIGAGAKVITTNSYALVPFHLGQASFETRGSELAALSGQLAKAAMTNRADVRIAGCLPPACGSYLPERFEPDAALQILSVLIDGLAPYADFWLAETMSSLTEARVTAQAVANSDADPRPLWISYSLHDEAIPNADVAPVLRSQEPVEDAVTFALDLGAEAVLFNCSQPEVMGPAVELASDVMAKRGQVVPIGVYANAFAPKKEYSGANEEILSMREDLAPEGYRHWADQWVAAGATIIGGCCGVQSPHIAMLRDHFNATITRQNGDTQRAPVG